jgi:hypothetical protein
MIVSKEDADKGLVLSGKLLGHEMDAYGSDGVYAELIVGHGFPDYTIKYKQGEKMTVHEKFQRRPMLTLKADALTMGRPWWNKSKFSLKMTGVKGENTYELTVNDTAVTMVMRPSVGQEGKR